MIKRYDLDDTRDPIEEDDGGFVKYDDHIKALDLAVGKAVNAITSKGTCLHDRWVNFITDVKIHDPSAIYLYVDNSEAIILHKASFIKAVKEWGGVD